MSSEILMDTEYVTGKTVNEMLPTEAAKYYASIGIVTQPLTGCHDKGNTPGKQPILPEWQRIEKPFTDIEIDQKFKNDKNIGYVCGSRSNLLVVDFDWFRDGIWRYIFRNVDMSHFVKVSHTDGKCHFIFQYCEGIEAGKYKLLGFDILSDHSVKGSTGETYSAGDNCVCSPSTHADGNI